MSDRPGFQSPAFLDSGRPDVPDLVVPRGVVPFYLPDRPVRGRLVRLRGDDGIHVTDDGGLLLLPPVRSWLEASRNPAR